jgi:hypothetical protein
MADLSALQQHTHHDQHRITGPGAPLLGLVLRW